MKFTKEPPYGLGELACIVNATIEMQKLNVPKLSTASMGQVNNTLVSIGFGYHSTNDLRTMWCQMIDVIDNMGLKTEERNDILKLAEQKFDELKSTSKLT